MIQYLIALGLFGTCYCAVTDLKPYDVSMAMRFKQEDHNGDGVITIPEIEQTFDRYDINGNGVTSRHEYTEYICATTPRLYNLSHYMYDEYDVNGDHHLQKSDYDGLHAKIDTDGDGNVTEAEFVAYWVALLNKFEGMELHGEIHNHGHSACH